MRFLFSALLLGARLAAAQSPGPADQIFTLPNPKDCGVITRLSPNLIENISPGCLQTDNNFYFDEDWSLSRRNGYAVYNLTACTGSQSIRGLWAFNATDGTKYLIAFSSNSMYSSKGDGTCSVISIAGANWNLSSTADMQCVQTQGQLACGDGVDAPFITDVVSSSTLAGAPIGPLMGTFRNRLLISGVAGNLTQLYLSGELNIKDWTVPAVQLTTSPAIISINGVNDGMKPNCLMGEFQNQYLIGRDYDLFALSGYDNRDFTLRRVSNQVGCIEPKSVQEVNNQLLWISKRGVELYTGTQITPVSYMIRPSIAQIIAAAGNSRSQLFTSQADFQGGTLCASGSKSCMSATISPGDVVPSSWSRIDTSTTDFSAGTIVGVTTTNVSGGEISAGKQFVNAGFETGNFSNWTQSGSSNLLSPLSASYCGSGNGGTFTQGGTYTGGANFCSACAVTPSISIPITVQVLNSVNTVLFTNSFTENNTFGGGTSAHNCTNNTINLGATTGQIKLQLNFNSGVYILTSPLFYATMVPTGIINFGEHAALPSCFNICDAGQTKVGISPGIDFYDPFYVNSSTFTSQCFDTGFSTPTWGGLVATQVGTGGGSNLAYATQVSNSCSGTFDVTAAIVNGAQITSAQKEFVQYLVNFQNSYSSNTVTVNDVTLAAATTGYYITPCVQVSSPASWGVLNVDAVTNGGTFTFYVSTGATCAASTATTAAWNLQSSNSNIGVSTATTFVASRVLFSMKSSTVVPTLNDMTFNWNTGSNRPPTSSIQYKDRYYLFYTTSTTGTPINDHAVVYDFNGKWTFLDDINAYSATLYLNQPYIGDSNATGTIYQLESGNSDNNKPFTASFKTGDLDFGVPAQLKKFERMYLFVNAPAALSQNINVTCQYSLDGSTTTYNLQSFNLTSVPEPTASGYGVAKYPFPTGSPTKGHWLNVSCNYTGSDGPLSIYGLQIIWTPINWD